MISIPKKKCVILHEGKNYYSLANWFRGSFATMVDGLAGDRFTEYKMLIKYAKIMDDLRDFLASDGDVFTSYLATETRFHSLDQSLNGNITDWAILQFLVKDFASKGWTLTIDFNHHENSLPSWSKVMVKCDMPKYLR